MNSGHVLSNVGAYATGRAGEDRACIPHPGGIELTLHAVALAGLHRKARVLDIGCGSGATVILLRSHEFNARGVDRAFTPISKIVDLYCQQASADNLPFASESFDAVLAECSLSVMQDPIQVLRECARVVRPLGKMIICDVYARQPDDIDTVRSQSSKCISGMLVREELEEWLQQCGFEVTCFEDHSKALREAMAQFIFDHDSPAELWGANEGCGGVEQIVQAMRQVRAGYFILTAVRL